MTFVEVISAAMARVDFTLSEYGSDRFRVKYTAEFQAPDGRWWALTLQPVEARSASIVGETP